LGGSLAVAASASAAQIPWGSSTDTGSATIYGLYNSAYGGLVGSSQSADAALTGLGDTAVPQYPNVPPESGTGALTSAQALQIGADFSGTTVTDGTTTKTPSSTTYAGELAVGDPTYSTDKPKIVAAAESWGELSSLITQLYNASDKTNFPGGLYSIDGDVSISSKATVTNKGKATAYSITAAVSGAASTGYVLPSAFTMTFPNDFTVNTALAGAELPASDEANPPAAQSIGTVTLRSPVANEFGGSTDTLTGNVFAINANNNIVQPDLELSFGQGIYLLGTFPSSLSFPLTVTFGEASVFGSPDPIPFSSLAINFPATTTPVKATNCSSLGAVTGTATDEVAGLAAEFGDTTDGYSASGNTAVTIASSNTVVTDLCPPTVTKARITGIKRGKPTVTLGLKGNGGTPFTSESITLPKGLSFKGLKAKDVKVSGARLKSVSGHGTKVTVNFKAKTRAATVDFVKGVFASSTLKKAVQRHKTKSLVLKYSVRYVPTGTAPVTSSVLSVTVKHIS
jgi:hypothetical protein